MKNIIISLSITITAVLFSRYIIGYELSGMVVLIIYFSIYLALFLINTKCEYKENDFNTIRENWPISGIFNKLGKNLGGICFLLVHFTSNSLSLFNPFQLKQIVIQYIGNLKLKKRLKPDGIMVSNSNKKYSLPFNGEWLVYNGGTEKHTSHSWDIYGQRYAYDFVKANQKFERHTGKGLQLEDYFCYGEEILAAADGEVISIENSIPNAPLVGFGFCDFLAKSFIGNYVIIKHDENEYSVYAHLIRGSVCVFPQEKVKKGQIIGRCGHSGHSSEPHLHFHLQDSPDFFNGMGLPIRFNNVTIDQVHHDCCFLRFGQFVQNGCNKSKSYNEVKSCLEND